MLIRPFANQIIVQPTEKKQILVSDNKNLCLYGKVTCTGSEVKEIKVGDIIIYEMWGLKSPEIDGEKVHFIREDSPFLLGIILEE
jgi:co-chaperonin GroES (HSP10)